METVKTYKKRQPNLSKDKKSSSSVTVIHQGKKVKFDIVADKEIHARRNKTYKFLI